MHACLHVLICTTLVLQVVGTCAVLQTTFVLDKIRASIEALGGTLEDVVRTRVFVTNIEVCAARSHEGVGHGP